ncbi:hypothetical protein PV08_02958 [Exophiala spinifera]|uniref:ABM domain-containing protein n=1 Tax=Exophiala spinifera TaxID=91928 RepID=A0A0D2C4Z9_9EURO|nr:uncharacterized protein PV08_02958 [Exophiala spinifera]KIW18669.1 hypothetical protein PV08_02958 [Exophiala spinifera]
MGATEIAILPLQEGKTFDDPTTADGQLHAELLKIVLAQPGCQRCYWGRQVEDKNVLRWFVDWDAVESHKQFMASDVYKPFLQSFLTILGGRATLYHAHFDPHPARAALSKTTSPATEIIHMYFPTSYSEEDKKKVADDIKALSAVLEKEGSDFRAAASGWVEEDVDIPGTDEKAKAFVVLFGWTSVEAHLAFRETKPFAENIHLLRGAKDLKKVHVVHSSLTEATNAS